MSSHPLSLLRQPAPPQRLLLQPIFHTGDKATNVGEYALFLFLDRQRLRHLRGSVRSFRSAHIIHTRQVTAHVRTDAAVVILRGLRGDDRHQRGATRRVQRAANLAHARPAAGRGLTDLHSETLQTLRGLRDEVCPLGRLGVRPADKHLAPPVGAQNVCRNVNARSGTLRAVDKALPNRLFRVGLHDTPPFRRANCTKHAGTVAKCNNPRREQIMGRDGANPTELLDQGRDEFIAFGGEVTQNEVTSLEQTGNAWTATTADGRQFPARQVLMATGITDELPNVPGLAELWGSRVFHCPYCHGYEARGRDLAVVGGKNPGFTTRMVHLLRKWTDRVTFFTNGLSLSEADRALFEKRGVVLMDAPVSRVQPDPESKTGVLVSATDPIEAGDSASTAIAIDQALLDEELQQIQGQAHG